MAARNEFAALVTVSQKIRRLTGRGLHMLDIRGGPGDVDDPRRRTDMQNPRNLAWRLSWYRQSELEGALLLGRMVRQASDPYLNRPADAALRGRSAACVALGAHARPARPRRRAHLQKLSVPLPRSHGAPHVPRGRPRDDPRVRAAGAPALYGRTRTAGTAGTSAPDFRRRCCGTSRGTSIGLGDGWALGSSACPLSAGIARQMSGSISN